jgi:hypothetical protein
VEAGGRPDFEKAGGVIVSLVLLGVVFGAALNLNVWLWLQVRELREVLAEEGEAEQQMRTNLNILTASYEKLCRRIFLPNRPGDDAADDRLPVAETPREIHRRRVSFAADKRRLESSGAPQTKGA